MAFNSINTIGGAPSGTAGASATGSGNNTLDQTDFLNLLVAQLKNQDPLEPLDNYQMASQMAQFSMVDSLTNMTEAMKNMESSQWVVTNLQAASLVGKNVEVRGSDMTVSEGKVTESSYQLQKSGKVTVTIKDENGNLVRTLEEGLQDTQKHKIQWDGKNQQGVQAADGKYTFQVAAVDDKGVAVPTTRFMVGRVEGVSFDQGQALVKVGSQQIPFTEILSVTA